MIQGMALELLDPYSRAPCHSSQLAFEAEKYVEWLNIISEPSRSQRQCRSHHCKILSS